MGRIGRFAAVPCAGIAAVVVYLAFESPLSATFAAAAAAAFVGLRGAPPRRRGGEGGFHDGDFSGSAGFEGGGASGSW